MKIFELAGVIVIGIFSLASAVLAQESHEHMKGMEMPRERSVKTPAKALQPAEGASIKIISPATGRVIKGDKVPLEFRLIKGKRGNHAHAYVDGELMGMFESEKGTLNGIKPGKHTLEVRVVARDHQTELDATDRVQFEVR